MEMPVRYPQDSGFSNSRCLYAGCQAAVSSLFLALFSYLYYIFLMSITQTVEIPANRRLTIDVPHEVPAGPTVIVFMPVNEQIVSETTASADEALNSANKIIKKHLPAFKELAK